MKTYKKHILICILLYFLFLFNPLFVYASNETEIISNYSDIELVEKRIKSPCGQFAYTPIVNFFKNTYGNIEKDEFVSAGLNYLKIYNTENNLNEKGYLTTIYYNLYPEKYIEPEYRNQKILDEKQLRHNMIGRWIIPDVKVDVAIFDINTQETVDKKDSAAYFKFGNMYLIADHWNQGFINIKNCVVGTKAYVDTGNGKKEYICTSIFQGHNTGKDLTDNNYNSLRNSNNNGITCYTCNGNWKNVWVVFFQPVQN